MQEVPVSARMISAMPMVHCVADRLSMRRRVMLDAASAEAVAAAVNDFAENSSIISRHHAPDPV